MMADNFFGADEENKVDPVKQEKIRKEREFTLQQTKSEDELKKEKIEQYRKLKSSEWIFLALAFILILLISYVVFF